MAGGFRRLLNLGMRLRSMDSMPTALILHIAWVTSHGVRSTSFPLVWYVATINAIGDPNAGAKAGCSDIPQFFCTYTDEARCLALAFGCERLCTRVVGSGWPVLSVALPNAGPAFTPADSVEEMKAPGL